MPSLRNKSSNIPFPLSSFGCSVSATAAGELERSAGFARAGAPATTVARVLWDLDQPTGGLRPGTVIVVDEASMIATRDLHRLVTAARAAGGAVKLIGDRSPDDTYTSRGLPPPKPTTQS